MSIMKTTNTDEHRVCPKCGSTTNQIKQGFTRAGTQRCKCKECGKVYCPNPKRHAYPEDVRQQAIKLHYSGVSGRSVGKVMGMCRANVYRWIKKTERGAAGSADR